MIHNPALQISHDPIAPRSYARAESRSGARASTENADDSDDDEATDDSSDDDLDGGGELERKLGSLVERQVESIRESLLESTMGSVERTIASLLKPNREKIPGQRSGGGERSPKRLPAALSAIRITPSEDAAYRLLPASEREFRNPVTDHYIAEWIRGNASSDLQRMRIAEDHLKLLSRADTLEGTVTSGTNPVATGSGAALLPLPYSTLIVRALNKSAKMRARATVYTSDSMTLRVPVRSVASVENKLEGVAAVQGEPSFTSKQFSKKKTQGNFEASYEMLEDSALNLVSIFAEAAGAAFAEHEDLLICTADGIAPNQTQSLGNATITAVSITAGTVGFTDLLKLYYALPQQYRTNAVWYAPSDVLQILASIRPAGGLPLLNQQTGAATAIDDQNAGAVGFIMNKPVIDVPLAAGTLFFGDPSKIGVLDGGGITARTYDISAADSIGFRYTRRWDCAVLLEGAWRKVTGITTAGS